MNVKEAEKIFKVFANKKRLEIIGLLQKNTTLSLREIMGEIRLTYRSTSKHLQRLSDTNIIDRETKGGEATFSINNQCSKFCDRLLSLLRDEL